MCKSKELENAPSFEEWKAMVKAEDDLQERQRMEFTFEYPEIFKDIHPTNFSLPKGWYNLVWEMCRLLKPFGVKCVQVKQKFGGLRFYIKHKVRDVNEEVTAEDKAQDEAYKVIEAFSFVSYSVCEECGSFGADLVGKGYKRSLCPSCSTKFNG